MKLYTKRGDDGGTDLFGGQRVRKDDPRVQAYGAVDELNSVIGLAATACRFDEIKNVLQTVQNHLFELGADLASPRKNAHDAEEPGVIPRIGPEHVAEIEHLIDQACKDLPPMRSFILPGGSELAARLHVARTVCRRAERESVSLAQSEPLSPDVIIFLNRISDLLFALARQANQLEGVADVPWKPRG